jgi:hypothetical protein
MKTIISSVVVIIIAITTIVFAQKPDREKSNVADTVEYIRKETIGGKLDFSSVLKSPGVVITHTNGIRFNKNDYYVFLWGQAVGELGVESSDKAARLWEEIHGKKLTGPQRTALKGGFEKK